MNGNYTRVTKRVPDAKKILSQLSLSEHIPRHPNWFLEHLISQEFDCLIWLIYRTAISNQEKYWPGEAISNLYLRSEKELMMIFYQIENECLSDPEYQIKMNSHPKAFYSKKIGTKIEDNVETNLYFLIGAGPDYPKKFRIEAKERLTDEEYPAYCIGVDLLNNGHIFFRKSLIATKDKDDQVQYEEVPANIEKHIAFNEMGFSAVRDVLMSVFENMDRKEYRHKRRV